MSKSNRYSPEVRERAVRLVFEHEKEYSSQWSAMRSIASRIKHPAGDGPMGGLAFGCTTPRGLTRRWEGEPQPRHTAARRLWI